MSEVDIRFLCLKVIFFFMSEGDIRFLCLKVIFSIFSTHTLTVISLGSQLLFVS